MLLKTLKKYATYQKSNVSRSTYMQHYGLFLNTMIKRWYRKFLQSLRTTRNIHFIITPMILSMSCTVQRHVNYMRSSSLHSINIFNCYSLTLWYEPTEKIQKSMVLNGFLCNINEKLLNCFRWCQFYFKRHMF